MGMHMAFFMCFPAANCRQGVVVLCMRLSGQFPNILFFHKDILHKKKPYTKKKPIKHTSNFYSDIFIRLRAYKANVQLLLRYYA